MAVTVYSIPDSTMTRIANRVRRVCKLLNFAKHINLYVIRPVGEN
jgi:hypothetical protein